MQILLSGRKPNRWSDSIVLRAHSQPESFGFGSTSIGLYRRNFIISLLPHSKRSKLHDVMTNHHWRDNIFLGAGETIIKKKKKTHDYFIRYVCMHTITIIRNLPSTRVRTYCTLAAGTAIVPRYRRGNS
jgi:hypothetical protein